VRHTIKIVAPEHPKPINVARLPTGKSDMNLPKENLPSRPRKNRKLVLILGGITILGMLALIGLVLLSNFPGPMQGSAHKSEAPPEDVSKAKP
jgi:hypothetical protein